MPWQWLWIEIADWWAWVAGAACFADVVPRERELLTEKMLSAEILLSTDGRYSLGPKGESQR